ncbi:hypothetical protein PACILC2_00770 [Paenibacillus cisolokensis]|uniref:YopX protein domain-containing protein n=1 Tax=Paenibacillus cisolokensis TaxID=1658519 RepID=A0ABQ4N026_9BACL|nr:YopX family protein [Paenibacillus cisolokensis]GIQ61509.1 hypothetical protein PACILC2_00770 [Paenibacillus cisolokensis]
MREIKFRAWYKGNPYLAKPIPAQMVYDIHKRHEAWPFSCRTFGGLIDSGDFIVMQYTGLKDKQWEKEIYEHDIIQFAIFDYNGHDTQYKGVVVFDGGQWQIWRTKDDPYFGSDVPFNLYMVWYNDDELEVIGNIYEHPHLLKGDGNE